MKFCRSLAGLVGCGLLFAAARAHAIGFDAAGNASREQAAVWSLGFEADDKTLPEAVPDSGNSYQFTDDEQALEGRRVLELQQFRGNSVPVMLPAVASAYRVSVWARGELITTVQVAYGSGRADDFAQLFPTGRMTSDGWYELETRGFSVDGTRSVSVTVGLFSTAAGKVDAIEFVPDGDASIGASCRGSSDKTSCGAGAVCQWGACRNAVSHVPALPPDAWRGDLVDYLDARFRYLYGPFENRRRDLPNALAEIAGMRQAADAWTFWNHFQVAVRRLHDWHTTGSGVSGFIFENPRPIALCLTEGVADLSQTIVPSHPDYLDLIVYRVGSVNTFGLAKGDRLVSVDGQHPLAWARSQIGVDGDYWTASNHLTHAEFAQRLPSLIAAFADKIEVLRCDATTKTCQNKPETISISDLAPSPPGTESDVSCDNRPERHIENTPENRPARGFLSGMVRESSQAEAIWGLEWSSLYVTGLGTGDAGAVLEGAVNNWRQRARGVILDHRTGHGGTTLGPRIIWNFVRTPIELDAFLFRARADDPGPQSLAEGQALFQKLAALGEVEKAGGPNPALDVPVALLIHLDGSASDWLPLGLKGSPKAKIFGPFETAGAFSTLFGFGYWFGLGYQIAVGDTVHVSGAMLNGDGVDPDVVVRPLQSDLIAGRDTVYDAAIAWVRQELKP